MADSLKTGKEAAFQCWFTAKGDNESRGKVSEEKRRKTHLREDASRRQWYASHGTHASRIWRGSTTISLRNTAINIAFDNEGA